MDAFKFNYSVKLKNIFKEKYYWPVLQQTSSHL